MLNQVDDELAIRAAQDFAARVILGSPWPFPEDSPARQHIRAIVARLRDAPAVHVVEFRDDGWTMRHPLVCVPSLFDCPYNRAGFDEPPQWRLGRWAVRFDTDGELVIGEGV